MFTVWQICKSEAYLSGCSVSLAQGRYIWIHTPVLKELASVLDEERRIKRKTKRKVNSITFVKPGSIINTEVMKQQGGILNLANGWKFEIDLYKMLVFPQEITTTNLKSDIACIQPKI
jgi:hypothetical protein